MTRLFLQRKILLITIIENWKTSKEFLRTAEYEEMVLVFCMFTILPYPETHVTLIGNQFNWMKLDFLLKLRHPAFLGSPTKVKFLLIRSL